jgi:hypothetical protein
VPADAQMEVRPGETSSRSRQADGLALLDCLPGPDLQLRQMKVHADQPVAVIDEDGVPCKEEILRKKDRAVSNRRERRPGHFDRRFTAEFRS